MIDVHYELEQLHQNPEWLTVLETYDRLITSSKKANPESQGWLTRLREFEGVEPDDLSHIHGSLIAHGFLRFQIVDRTSGMEYQLSQLGKQALTHQFVEDEDDEVIISPVNADSQPVEAEHAVVAEIESVSDDQSELDEHVEPVEETVVAATTDGVEIKNDAESKYVAVAVGGDVEHDVEDTAYAAEEVAESIDEPLVTADISDYDDEYAVAENDASTDAELEEEELEDAEYEEEDHEEEEFETAESEDAEYETAEYETAEYDEEEYEDEEYETAEQDEVEASTDEVTADAEEPEELIQLTQGLPTTATDTQLVNATESDAEPELVHANDSDDTNVETENVIEFSQPVVDLDELKKSA